MVRIRPTATSTRTGQPALRTTGLRRATLSRLCRTTTPTRIRPAATPTRTGQPALRTAGLRRAAPGRLCRAAALRRRLQHTPTATEEEPQRSADCADRDLGRRPGLRSLVVPRQERPASRQSIRDPHRDAGVLTDPQQRHPVPRQDATPKLQELGNGEAHLAGDHRRGV